MWFLSVCVYWTPVFSSLLSSFPFFFGFFTFVPLHLDVLIITQFWVTKQFIPSSLWNMADSDRSRSPASTRNRGDQRGQDAHVRPGLPFFPRWVAPMQTMVWPSSQMSRPQYRPQCNPQITGFRPGPYMMNQSMASMNPLQQNAQSNPCFPPTPPSLPPTLPYPIPPRMASPPCSPTLKCPSTQATSPSTPTIPSSQPRHGGTPLQSSPGGHSTIEASRSYGFDPNPHWQEDKEHYDNQKINGLTFPKSIRQSAFSQKLDIEGCDPLKLPVAALLYQQANNFWLRKLAHGREVFLIPTGDIAAVVFTTELLTQLRNKGVDIDRVSSSKARQDGKLLDKTQNTKYTAQQVADIIHSWVPTKSADPDTQQELTNLRSQLAQLRQQLGEEPGNTDTTGPSASSPSVNPIQAALMRSSGNPPPPNPPAFDPSSLLVGTTTPNAWLSQNLPSSFAARPFQKWLKELPISEPKRKVLTDNLAKTETWWNNQPAEAIETVNRVAVMMGIPVSMMSKNMDAMNLLKTMTAAISMTNWLAPQLRRSLKHKVLQSHLQIIHSMILILYILTPFTMTYSIHIFQGFRIIQTRMMLLSILHGLRPNPKLKSILEGCTDLTHLWGSTLASHNQFSRPFFQPDAVYIRFTHITNLQPKFYLGSAMHSVVDREYSRSRKFLQLINERLVHAELALRYWQEHDNLYVWAPIPIYTNRSDFRCLELALIQEWQPRLNFPFICKFFHPKRGLLKKPPLNTNSQFGLATLWRRSRHRFTPELVRKVLSSSRFQNRLELWTIIHALGSNTKARFEHIKLLRSNDGGLTLCYALRRLANNIQEPFRTLSLGAIDATIKWWKGKPAPKASALRAPWSLTPDLHKKLKQFLRSWHHKMIEYQVPCHLPSFKTVFIKHAAVLDQLCNHKQSIIDWSTDDPPVCCCKSWSTYKAAVLNPQEEHWVLSGSLLSPLLPPSLAVIAEGSLSNKVFPSKKEYLNQLHSGLRQWTKRNGLPSMPLTDIENFGKQLWHEHHQHVTQHITKSSITQLHSTFEEAVFHCEDKQASSLRIYCPCLYYKAISNTFQDQSIFENVDADPTTTVTSLVATLTRQHGQQYPWAIGAGRQLPAGYILAKRKKSFNSGRPIISFVDSPFRPMLNILARLIFQLIPVACPDHFATGDVYHLLSILRSAPIHDELILVNQDLAGFFTSIDQDRFVRSWFMLLDFLRPKMNVSNHEVFSVYPGKSNNPGDIIKGRTFRRLNVTRKIVIQDVPDLIKSALDMQTFALGHKCILQKRGSPMGSPLSPALCLMVVSISEQIWSINFNQLLSNHSLFVRHIRYVDNRLIFGDKRLLDLAPYEVLLDDGFYGKPIILETEPDQEFLGFMLETQPLELIYQGPTNISQVLSPFSASPPKVLLSGFRSRCHIVIKGAFPQFRVLQGLDQLIRLYTTAGFPKEDLQTISDQLLLQHSASGAKNLRFDANLVVFVLCLLPFPTKGLVFTLGFFLFASVVVLMLHACSLCSQRVFKQSRSQLYVFTSFAMDHAQGRAFHHHLARAIMHLNFLAGLLPFFEPSIEVEEGPPTTPPYESQSHRSLHTFVPLPTHRHPPTLASHGGIPSRLIVNPEPHLRPITAFSSHASTSTPSHHCQSLTDFATTRASPTLPIHMERGGPLLEPQPEPNPMSTIPHPSFKPTIPVPVRSKQRSRTMENPPPAKKSRSEEAQASLSTAPHSSTHSGPTPAPPPTFEYEDTDESDSAYSHRLSTIRANKAMPAPNPCPPWGKAMPKAPPALSPPPPVAITSTVTLTPNPNETTPATEPSEEMKPPAPETPTLRGGNKPILDRPWTTTDDAQLTSMKQDTRSRPSWKTIGARLERDPQLCKMRWALLKRADEEGRITGPVEPETGD